MIVDFDAKTKWTLFFSDIFTGTKSVKTVVFIETERVRKKSTNKVYSES